MLIDLKVVILCQQFTLVLKSHCFRIALSTALMSKLLSVARYALIYFLSNHLIYQLLQNCTVWDGGSLGSGNLSASVVMAYVASTTTPVDDPADVASTFAEHDEFSFFGVDLSAAQSDNYTSYTG